MLGVEKLDSGFQIIEIIDYRLYYIDYIQT